MAEIKVTWEQLHQLSSQLASGSSEIEQRLSSMQSSLQPLFGGDWVGTASSQFQELWQQWHHGAAQLKQGLDGISKLLGNAATEYQKTEDAIKGSMSQ
jgi:WXG100 family type VII secretion target